MSGRMDKLWRDMGRTDPAPAVAPDAVRRRVNAALDAAPPERKRYMRHKVRFAAVLAAAILALTGAALAVGYSLDVFGAFFEGDPAPAQELVDREIRSVSDENYTFTVDSSMSDGQTALLLVRVDALSEAGKARLNADDFENMDTFDFSIPHSGAGAEDTPRASGWGVGERRDLRTETSRTWAIDVRLEGGSQGPAAIRAYLGPMADGLYVEVPLAPAEAVTVEIGADGQGTGTLTCIDGGPVTLERVTLSPLTLRMEFTHSSAVEDALPQIFLLMADGSLRTPGQLFEIMTDGTGETRWGTVQVERNFRLRSVLDLSQVAGVVFEGMAYPLDGGAPTHYTVDPALFPFRLPLEEPLVEGEGHPINVRALCEGLGASYDWDDATQTAAMTYRGVTIVLTAGSSTALVDGEPVEQFSTPQVRDGKLLGDYRTFTDTWKLDMCAAYDSLESSRRGNGARVGQLITP